jgi:serine/threonine protein phosphatase PrpC
LKSETQSNQPPKTLAVGVGAVSETGQREQNQDRMTGFNSAFGAVYVVADGMGGHRGGAEASRMVTEAFSRHLLAAPASSPPPEAITLALRLTNLEVMEKGRSGNPEFEGMGSTVVIALLRDTPSGMELTTAHVGDSRVYLRRNGALTQLTKDHTQVQRLLDTHAIDEASARNHPDASVLTRAIGHTTDLEVDINGPIPLQGGDYLILCSDGLSGFASAEDIDRTIAQNPDPSKCASKLVQLALASGSNDNITVQVLRIGNASRRARKTEPGASVMPARSRWGLWASLCIVIALIGAGVVYWLRKPPTPIPVAAPDPAISQLAQRIKTFQTNVSSLHSNAKAGQDAIARDLKDLDALQDEAGKPEALKKELKNLRNELPKVGKQFGEVLSAAGELDKHAHLDVEELPKPDSTTTGKTSADRAAKIEKIKRSLDADEKALDDRRGDLSDARDAQADLEDREAALKKQWQAAHTEVKPVPKPPPKGDKSDRSQD